jgi:hypothetical protein
MTAQGWEIMRSKKDNSSGGAIEESQLVGGLAATITAACPLYLVENIGAQEGAKPGSEPRLKSATFS